MDDDEDERDFSKSIVYDFFQQADSTFQKMDKYLSVAVFSIITAIILAIHGTIVEARVCMLIHHSRAERDLFQLSALGHFLKGSSATLGLTKLKDSCEKIQHFGAHKDETGTREESDDEVSLKRLRTTIAQAKVEFQEAERKLRNFYHDNE